MYVNYLLFYSSAKISLQATFRFSDSDVTSVNKMSALKASIATTRHKYNVRLLCGEGVNTLDSKVKETTSLQC